MDKVEFMLLALDRKTLFSQDNMTQLFNYWDQDGIGSVSIANSVRRMFQYDDGSEDQEKLERLYGGIACMQFCPQPEHDDYISLNNFFVICRDIFGINTFEFEEDQQ